MTATVVPRITGAISQTALPQGFFQRWQRLWQDQLLADVCLADRTSQTQINMLIVNDFYLDLTLPDRIELQPGLYLLASRLGWIVSG